VDFDCLPSPDEIFDSPQNRQREILEADFNLTELVAQVSMTK